MVGGGNGWEIRSRWVVKEEDGWLMGISGGWLGHDMCGRGG